MKPKLSIIVTTRNDNHGGDLIKRTSTFINGLIYQCTKFSLEAELIIVEWNPPSNKQLLKDILPLPQKDCPISIRYIIVPNALHSAYKFHDNIPLYQMIAKNVGLRRAKGEWLLCTNIDLLFSDECIKFLASNSLKKNHFYRCSRMDVPKEVMNFNLVEEQLEFASENILARHGSTSNYKYINIPIPRFFYYFPRILNFIDYVLKIINKGKFHFYSLDFDACGDFTLMHKEDWINIDGYVELDLYSIHVDSMAIISAKALGMEQICLPKEVCTYHIYHEDGWSGFKDPVDLVRFLSKRPGLDWFTVCEAGKHLVNEGKNWNLNKPDWGFANENFKEYIFERGKPMKEIN
jgi:hypothetical protein